MIHIYNMRRSEEIVNDNINGDDKGKIYKWKQHEFENREKKMKNKTWSL